MVVTGFVGKDGYTFIHDMHDELLVAAMVEKLTHHSSQGHRGRRCRQALIRRRRTNHQKATKEPCRAGGVFLSERRRVCLPAANFVGLV
jgi:hypothetical protein